MFLFPIYFNQLLCFAPIAIRKSQKDASILVERSCRSKGTERNVMGSSSRESKLAYDLRSQWRSLFLHMEEKFEHEGNQLVSVPLVCAFSFRLYTYRTVTGMSLYRNS